MSKLIHQEFGGLKKGRNYCFAMNVTWPLAKLEIYSEKIVLKYLLFFEIEFRKHEIDRVKRFQGALELMGEGVVIFHHKKSASPFVVFWSFSPDKLLRQIQDAGYAVE